MNENQSADYVVPVVSEEVHADAIPVETGGVRVTKRVEGHDELLEQELRKGRVEVKRVRVNRTVEGPQPTRREASTLIIPVMSEVLKIEKQWVVTEEIHVTQLEERETVRQKVAVNHEVAEVERLDEQGAVVSTLAEPRRVALKPIAEQPRVGAVRSRRDNDTTERRRVLAGDSPSMVKKS